MRKFLLTLCTRFGDLLIKLISVKGLVFGVATWLVATEKIDWWGWLATAAIVIGGRTLEKLLGSKPLSAAARSVAKEPKETDWDGRPGS